MIYQVQVDLAKLRMEGLKDDEYSRQVIRNLYDETEFVRERTTKRVGTLQWVPLSQPQPQQPLPHQPMHLPDYSGNLVGPNHPIFGGMGAGHGLGGPGTGIRYDPVNPFDIGQGEINFDDFMGFDELGQPLRPRPRARGPGRTGQGGFGLGGFGLGGFGTGFDPSRLG
jgi:hypothetical protein